MAPLDTQLDSVNNANMKCQKPQGECWNHYAILNKRNPECNKDIDKLKSIYWPFVGNNSKSKKKAGRQTKGAVGGGVVLEKILGEEE